MTQLVKAGLSRLYREFFAHAERKRRWSLEDVPWQDVNRGMSPAVADVVESFCAVELYLPDYVAKTLPLLRTNKGWSFFQINWGYEESKHSLALGDWLLRSGARSEEQMADLESMVASHEWQLPHDSASGMLIYGMVQELATWVYKPLMEWTCQWAAGEDDEKAICDAIIRNIGSSGLRYGHPLRVRGDNAPITTAAPPRWRRTNSAIE